MFRTLNNNILFAGADPLETAANDDGPDCGPVQVCPHRPHQISRPVEAHLIKIFLSNLYMYGAKYYTTTSSLLSVSHYILMDHFVFML